MLLVANGCSHTSGAEIEKHRNSECHEKAWPKHLADIWDCDHVNLSLCGGSNARVIKRGLHYMILHGQIRKII